MAVVRPSSRPLIAINGLLEPGERPRLALPLRYADALLKAGAVPVVIPPVGGPADLARLLARVDGLLLTGGDDFTTEPLGLGATHPRAVRTPLGKQALDLALARAALDGGLPTLGICYGMQCLGLADGAGLLQHLPDDRPGMQEHSGGRRHAVGIAPESKLARSLRVERLDVVSRHHQALADAPAGWAVAARDDEGLIEAIEHAAHPFAIGVQWHPELDPEGTPSDRLFQALVAAAALGAPAHLAPGAR